MVTIIINFSGLSRGSGVGLLSFARKLESCIDLMHVQGHRWQRVISRQ